VSTLDAAGVGASISIVKGSDNLMFIAYQDQTNRMVKAIHCPNAICSPSSPRIVDAANSGNFTSAAIGTDGFPLISYFSSQLRSLVVSHCTDISCSSVTTASVVYGGRALVTFGRGSQSVFTVDETGDVKINDLNNNLFSLLPRLVAIENRLAIQENIAIIRNFGNFASTTAATYVDVTGRTVAHTKISATSDVLVTWQDNFGFFASATPAGVACTWRVTVDNVQQGETQVLYGSPNEAGQWRLTPQVVSWYLLASSVPAGVHTYRAQVNLGTSADQCRNGYVTTQETFLMIQEIPR
jgi:hypothetical protein